MKGPLIGAEDVREESRNEGKELRGRKAKAMSGRSKRQKRKTESGSGSGTGRRR